MVTRNVLPHVTDVSAQRHDDTDSVIRIAVEVIDNVVSCVVSGVVGETPLKADMTVEVDQCWHHCLTGKVNHGRASWRSHRALGTDVSNHTVVNDDGGSGNRVGPVTCDDVCTVKHNSTAWRGRLYWWFGCAGVAREQDKQ